VEKLAGVRQVTRISKLVTCLTSQFDNVFDKL